MTLGSLYSTSGLSKNKPSTGIIRRTKRMENEMPHAKAPDPYRHEKYEDIPTEYPRAKVSEIQLKSQDVRDPDFSELWAELDKINAAISDLEPFIHLCSINRHLSAAVASVKHKREKILKKLEEQHRLYPHYTLSRYQYWKTDYSTHPFSIAPGETNTHQATVFVETRHFSRSSVTQTVGVEVGTKESVEVGAELGLKLSSVSFGLSGKGKLENYKKIANELGVQLVTEEQIVSSFTKRATAVYTGEEGKFTMYIPFELVDRFELARPNGEIISVTEFVGGIDFFPWYDKIV